MNTIKKKLLISGVSLVVALVLIASATLAWFTLSTKPEASGISLTLSAGRTLLLSSDGVNYAYTIDLSGKFANLASLHPVSTADGIHWYIPQYNQDGSLASLEEFVMDMVGEGDVYDNVNLLDGNGNKLTGLALLERENNGYYVWTDFYIKTEEKDGCDVVLSIPNKIDQTELGGNYGSYVLPAYGLNSADNAQEISNRAECAVRIGFLIMNGSEADRFVIYEPNADKRSSSGKPDDTPYIKGYTVDSNYAADNYIQTEPITWEEVVDHTKTVYTEYVSSTASTKLYAEYEFIQVESYNPSSKLPYYTYSLSQGYTLYDTSGYLSLPAEDRPTLYQKNYVQQDYYEPDTGMHYLAMQYQPYVYHVGDTVYEKLYVRSNFTAGEPTYTLLTTTPQHNTTYYIQTYVPQNFDETYTVYDTAANSYSTLVHKPVLYTASTVNEQTVYTATAYSDDSVTYYIKTFTEKACNLPTDEKLTNLYAYGFVGNHSNDGSDSGVTLYSCKTEDVKKGTASVKPVESSRMIVQKSGSYDSALVQAALLTAKQQEKTAVLNSTMVDSFGKFITPTEATETALTTNGYAAINETNFTVEYFSDTVIVHLNQESKTNPATQIRLFIWIEGQDVDCWNDITSGAFNINLEFAAYTE